MHLAHVCFRIRNHVELGLDTHCEATRKVTLATKSLLLEYLVPERVGHAVGTGSMSRVLIRT